MKLDDLKWAVGELVSAALRRPHAGCACHPGRLSYRSPARPGVAEGAARTEPPDEDGDRRDG